MGVEHKLLSCVQLTFMGPDLLQTIEDIIACGRANASSVKELLSSMVQSAWRGYHSNRIILEKPKSKKS